MKEERLASRHIVLIGIGHTNAHVVRMWRMHAIPDADLTCISDRSVATYSGMLPAVLAGQLAPEKMQIDLVRLSASVGARLIVGNVAGIDREKHEVRFDDRPPIPYDVLSIGIGSVPTTSALHLGSGEKMRESALIKIKPMQTFLGRLRARLERLKAANARVRVVVVGSGVAGLEILFCIQPFLTRHGFPNAPITLVSNSSKILPEVDEGTRRRVEKEVRRRGHEVLLEQRVVEVADDSLQVESGQRLQATVVIWATGASPPPALSHLGLPLDERGFLATDKTLRIIGANHEIDDRPIFAVGDTGTIVGQQVPKAGVFAVRQGPVLWQNIQRSLNGQTLVEYSPQKSFLKLLNLGDGRAVGQWHGWSFSGRWAYWLKNRIDSSFMEKFEPPAMGQAMQAMQCRGCGCKLAADALGAAISGFDERLEITNDDAAEVGVRNGNPLLASTDFFTTPFDDAYLAGRITAIHSASDLIATGASVREALANVVIPEGDLQSQQRLLSDFMSGARREFQSLGAKIVGGHTIVGPRMEAGFTVIGPLLSGLKLAKSGLQEGDRLYLTKPLGSGVLLAAHMRSACAAEDYEQLLAWMLQNQSVLAQVAVDCQIAAATDVTGFGLAGHLLEMLHASRLAATIRVHDIPMLDAAKRAAAAGIESSLFPSNLGARSAMRVHDSLSNSPEFRLLFDPQTCGGLLFGVPQSKEREFAERLESLSGFADNGPLRWRSFGEVHAAEGGAAPLRVVE